MKNGISLNELEAVHFARLFDTIDQDISAVYLDSPDVIAEKFGIQVQHVKLQAHQGSGGEGNQGRRGQEDQG